MPRSRNDRKGKIGSGRANLGLIVTLIVACVSFTLTSCATTGNYEEALQSWVGQDVNRLINSWGPPSDEYGMPNGNTVYTWLWVGGTRVLSNYNETLNMVTTQAVTSWCKTSFTVNTQGVIRLWRWQGNACRAR